MHPSECISPETFYWDHVMRKRKKYQELLIKNNEYLKYLVSRGIPNPEVRAKESYERELDRFFNWSGDPVCVDHALITEPLTQEQINAANDWKVKYLNRLRNENWDESYIKAYLQAWNLTEDYVFENRDP